MKDTEANTRPPRNTANRRSQTRGNSVPIEHDDGNYSDPRYDDSYEVASNHEVEAQEGGLEQYHGRSQGYRENGYNDRPNGYQGHQNGYHERRPNGYYGRNQEQGYQGREGGYQGRGRSYGGQGAPQRQYQPRHQHPNGYRPKMLVLITTRDIENEEDVTRRVINYHNPEARQWLSRHSYWALCNNKTVLSGPYENDEQAESYEDHDIPDFDNQIPE